MRCKKEALNGIHSTPLFSATYASKVATSKSRSTFQNRKILQEYSPRGTAAELLSDNNRAPITVWVFIMATSSKISQPGLSKMSSSHHIAAQQQLNA
jgi:hypothetical protein